MTIERGLRLMAGVFVLLSLSLSLALGYWVNPAGTCSQHS
jgi:hypothetical protein